MHGQIIREGLAVLRQEKGYSQTNLVNKINLLGVKCSEPLMSNIINEKGGSPGTRSKVAQAIKAIVQQELDMRFDETKHQFVPQYTPGWQPEIIPDAAQPKEQVRIHDGRVSVEYKTAFFSDATTEVLEIGARLNTFSQYFTSYKSTVYKDHIIALLKKGVNVKAYLVDPDSNEASLYFQDRARTQKDEKYGPNDVKRIVEKLHGVSEEIASCGYKGKFEIFCYKHMPYANYFVVDGDKPYGKLLVSQYLYGLKRAECPVWEVHRRAQGVIFRKYWESVQQFIEDAVPIGKKIEKWGS